MSNVHAWLSTAIHKNTYIGKYPYRILTFPTWMPQWIPIHDKVSDAIPTIMQVFLEALYQAREPYDVQENVVSRK
jgi:hypothetical protein